MTTFRIRPAAELLGVSHDPVRHRAEGERPTVVTSADVVVEVP